MGLDAVSEVALVQIYFYIGGEYIDDGVAGHILKHQMYVEKLSLLYSSNNCSDPIILTHRQRQTALSFLNIPDGGISWSLQFLEADHTVYIVDQFFCGRSAWAPYSGAIAPSTYSAELTQQHLTIPERYRLQPQTQVKMQWPSTGVTGEPVFDAFYSSNVQFISNTTYQQRTVQPARAQLSDLLSNSV